MTKIRILGTSTVLIFASWWGAGAIAGCVVGWKIHQRYFD